MDPEDLIIVDYQPLLKPLASPPTSNSSIDSKELNSDDYFIKLNQAWEKEVKNRNDVIDWIMEMERKYEKYMRIGSVIPEFSAKSFVMGPDIQPIQPIQKTPHKD